MRLVEEYHRLSKAVGKSKLSTTKWGAYLSKEVIDFVENLSQRHYSWCNAMQYFTHGSYNGNSIDDLVGIGEVGSANNIAKGITKVVHQITDSIVSL